MHIAREFRFVAAIGLAALTLIAASCQEPTWTAFTPSETVGPHGDVEFVGGIIQRQVRVSIPGGVLDEATGGSVRLSLSSGTASAASAVQFRFDEPADGSATVEAPGETGYDFEWDLPTECIDGCEALLPVTIQHLGDDEPPRVTWSALVSVEYRSVSLIPPEAQDIRAAIEGVEGNGS